MEYTKEVVCAGPSRHGLGVFASRSFSIGDYIGPIEGELLTDPEYGSEYAIDVGDQTLEPAAPFRYLNHSCQPNAELVICDEHADRMPCDPSVWLEVVREIAPGEPMTIDYAWPADVAIPCQCGTPRCRGWIVSEAGLNELKVRERICSSSL